jgi:hypothetical protein
MTVMTPPAAARAGEGLRVVVAVVERVHVPAARATRGQLLRRVSLSDGPRGVGWCGGGASAR